MCSITTTKRRRFFWAVWSSAPPSRVPFKRPDFSDGGAESLAEAEAAAEARIGMSVVLVDPLWARAWIRVLRGEAPWPSKASREPSRAARPEPTSVEPGSVWAILGVSREATEAELKAAFRRRALETHPDQGGSEEAFRSVLRAHDEAKRRIGKPRARRATKSPSK